MHATYDPENTEFSRCCASPRAREQGKSANEVAFEALARGAGVMAERVRQRDLRDMAGTWRSDRGFDRALAAQDTIAKELWR